ncbi:MAG: glycosyltransferase family 2 protein [Candidatus Omnitrophota bacterium]
MNDRTDSLKEWPWIAASGQLPAAMPDGTPWPRITVVTPNRNYGRFLEATIRSVLLQGYPNLEYIIIDGGSTDESVDVIKQYSQHLSFWETAPDRGQSDAINKGFRRATGTICAWLNSDDIYCPDTLRKVAEHWAANKGCAFLTGMGEIIGNATGKREHLIKAGPYGFHDLVRVYDSRYLPQPSVFFSRDVFNDAGGLDERLKYSMDLDLWLRLIQKHRLYHIPETLSQLRHHPEALSWKHNEAALEEVSAVVGRYIGGLPVFDRISVITGYRFLRASTMCHNGLNAYFEGQSGIAARKMIKALLITPVILFSRSGIKLLSRIILPMGIKKRIFRNP